MRRTVAYFVESQSFGGSERALLHLIGALDPCCWHPIIFHRPEAGIGPLLESAHTLKVETRAVPWLHGTRAPYQLIQIISALRAVKPSVFHAQLHWPLACQAGIVAAALARVPIIVATIQLFVPMSWHRSIRWQQRIVGSQVDRYIAVSSAMAEQLTSKLSISALKIRVVHNAIPVERFNLPVNPELRILMDPESKRRIVLTVARLNWQKGHQYLLAAALRVPEAVFVLVGDGDERERLEAQARALGIADRVIFLGQRDDVPDLLAACDLFVLPSLYEGLPLSVLEAMAAGKPVVATAIAGTSEAVMHGKTGILVPPADPNALAQAIQALLADPQFAQKLAAAARARVQEHFSAQAMAQQVSQIYTKLLSQVSHGSC